MFKQLKADKLALELAIAEAVSALLGDFQNLTGLSVSRVDVPLIDITQHGSDGRQFIIGRPSVDIEL